jgi:predicted nucleic acid-binding protein
MSLFKNSQMAILRSVDADNNGSFTAPNLRLARASKNGFETVVRSGVVVTVGSEGVIDFNLNRLTDDQSQRRIREEADAVELILRCMHSGEVLWISSEALTDEINRNPHLERRRENAALLNLANHIIEVDSKTAGRAKDLEAAGYGTFDALHLACAGAAQVDVLLTTDDGFVRKASRRDGNPLLPVRNPVSWSKGNLP